MGKKLMVSLAMEGKLQAEGLQMMHEDDDLLTAMARELVTRQGVGEQAAEVWRSLQQRHQTSIAAVAEPISPPCPTFEESTEVQGPLLPSSGPVVQLSLF